MNFMLLAKYTSKMAYHSRYLCESTWCCVGTTSSPSVISLCNKKINTKAMPRDTSFSVMIKSYLTGSHSLKFQLVIPNHNCYNIIAMRSYIFFFRLIRDFFNCFDLIGTMSFVCQKNETFSHIPQSHSLYP